MTADHKEPPMDIDALLRASEPAPVPAHFRGIVSETKISAVGGPPRSYHFNNTIYPAPDEFVAAILKWRAQATLRKLANEERGSSGVWTMPRLEVWEALGNSGDHVRLPFELNYSVPAMSRKLIALHRRKRGTLPHMYGKLQSRLAEIGPLPLGADRSFLAAGTEFFNLVTDYRFYPVRFVEHWMTDNNIHTYQKHMVGKKVLNLGASDCIKARRTLEKVMTEGAGAGEPAHYYVNDIIAGILPDAKIRLSRGETVSRPGPREELILDMSAEEHEAFLRAEREFYGPKLRRSRSRTSSVVYPENKITTMPGDIFDDGFYENPSIQEIDTVIFEGATWNNFSYEQKLYLLDKFATKFKPGTIFMIVVDETCSEVALSAGYKNNPAFLQWILTSVATSLHKAGFHHLDPAQLTPDVVITPYDDFVGLQSVVYNHRPLSISIPGTDAYYTLAEGPILVGEEFQKQRSAWTHQMFKQRGFEINHRETMHFHAQHALSEDDDRRPIFYETNITNYVMQHKSGLSSLHA